MPTNMSMSDIVNPALAAGMAGQKTAQGIQSSVTDMANTMTNLQTQQQKQQEMQQQLQTMKYNSAMGLVDSANKMSDPVFKTAEDTMEKRMKQINPDYQDGTLAAMRSDPNLKAGMMAYREAVLTGKIPSGVDPTTGVDHRKLVLDAMGDPGQLEQLATSFNEQRKLESAQAMKAAALATSRQNNADTNATKVTTAGITAGAIGNRGMNPVTLGNAYSKEMGPTENVVYQGDRVLGILKQIDLGNLKSTKTLTADANSAVASMLGGGKPSTVYGQQATHMDDVYERLQNGIQFLTANPQDTQAPAKLQQLKLDVKALQDFADQQHQQRYDAFRQTLAANPSQQAQTGLKGLDNRYQTFRKAHGMDASIADGTALPAPTAAPTPAPQGQMTPLQQQYIQKMVQAGLTQDQAVQRMQAKGIK